MLGGMKNKIWGLVAVVGLMLAGWNLHQWASAQTGSSLPLPPNITNCGTAVGCANSPTPGAKWAYGSAPLSSGTPSTATLTGLPFSSSGSYFCVGVDATNAANNLIKFANSSGSSTTITGPTTVTDVINYICMGT